MPRHARLGDRWMKSVCILGFGSITTALLVAHRNPATEYELSIYTATPGAFWLSLVAAFVASAVVAFGAERSRYHRLGLLLGGLACFSVMGLSVMRGYFFQGIHDSMTHVGVTRDLVSGATMPHDSIYPGLHVVSAFLGELAGFSVWQATLVGPLFITAGVFLVFVPLVVRALVGSRLALTVGAFSAFLLVPFHQLASTLRPHPSSQAIVFAPLVLYLLVAYLRSHDPETRGVSPVGVLLLVAAFASILYHPMQAVNLLALFLVIAIHQSLSGLREGGDSGQRLRPLTPVTLVFGVALTAWVLQSPAILTLVQAIGDSLAGFVLGTSEPAGAAVDAQSTSLQAIGASLPVFFLKMFGVSTLFALVSGVVLATALTGWVEESDAPPDASRLVLYLTGGLVAMAGIFGVYVVGNIGQYFFRQASFMMVVLTVIGAVGIASGTAYASKSRARSVVVPGLVVVFAVLFVSSSLLLYNSPYIHRANQQVTDARVDGYETAFELTGESVVSGVMQEPERYHVALYGERDGEGGRLDGAINASQLRDLQGQQSDDWYLVITRNTYERELVAYRSHRFSRGDFASVSRQPGVGSVHTNGDFEMYYVP